MAGTMAKLASALVALVGPTTSHASIHCVATVGTLVNALAVAEENGEADEIRIVGGSYALSASLVYSSHEAFGAILSGRWNAACTNQDGAPSMLDGQNLTRILQVNVDVDAALAITDLQFTRGADRALLVETAGRDVLIERNVFVGNRSAAEGAGARIAVSTSGSLVVVRNNIVFGNTAPEGAGLVVNAGIGEAYINGNTVVANTATIAGALCGGLCIAGGSDFSLSNNILWNNGGADLYNASTASTLLFCNDVGTFAGTPPGASGSANFSIPPGFAAGLLNLQLDPRSPLVNRGCFAFGGSGDLDVARAMRRQGRAIDIGAHETDVLFRGPFDP
jgi:hypothetical protein